MLFSLRAPLLLSMLLFAVGLTACSGDGTNDPGPSDDDATSDVVLDMPGDTTPDTTPPDPCAGIANPCADEGAARCEGSARVTCRLDANGCLAEASQDCAATAEVCVDGTCRTGDPCATVAQPCPQPLRACEGNNLVSCSPDANGCLVLTVDDCATLGSGGTCTSSGPGQASCGTPTCADVERPCDRPAWRECGDVTTGGERVVYCDYDAKGCLVEREQECAPRWTCIAGTQPGTAACTEPCTDDPACPGLTPDDPAQTRCNGSAVETCDDVDDDGCVELVVTACGTGNACVDDPTAGPVCDVVPETVFGSNPFTQGAPETFVPLTDGSEITVTQGFQGTWMFVLALRTRGTFSGQLDVSVEVTVTDPGTGTPLEKSLSLGGVGLQDGGDGYFYVYDYMLDLGTFEPPAMGTPVTMTIAIEDQLGTTWDARLEMTVGEAVGI